MRAIAILRNEHRWIAGMGECLWKLVADARDAGRLAPETGELLDLYESFADGRHQAKEEDLLFGELIATADASERRILARLLADHEAELGRMAGLRRNLAGAIRGEPLSVSAFARAAEDYLELHRLHMHHEGAVVFPLAERLLDPDGDARVTAGFERIEGGAGDPQGVEERIRALRAGLGLPDE